MARVTWQGDDSGDKEKEFMGVKFEKGKAVDTDSGPLIERIRGDKAFKLEPTPESPTKVDTQGQKMEDEDKESKEKPKHPETGKPTHNPAVASTSNPPGTSPIQPPQRGGQKPEKK